MKIKDVLRKQLWRFGFNASHPSARRKRFFQSFGIDAILDVGANSGQFARQMRKEVDFKGRIISFEPLSSAFDSLKKNSAKDSLWDAYNFALGDDETESEINIAGNSYSSSFLNMLPAHTQFAPESEYVGRELIKIKTLDSIFKNLNLRNKNIYLKMDTQGFEDKVLRGAEKSLSFIGTIQLEMSLIPLYQGELLFDEMHKLVAAFGYDLISVEQGFTDNLTGRILQIDGIYHRF